MKLVIIIAIAFVLLIPVSATAQFDFTLLFIHDSVGGEGGRAMLGSDDPLTPEEIVESYFNNSLSYLALNNNDLQLLSDVFNEYLPKIMEELPKEVISNSAYFASNNEEWFDGLLEKAGLKEEFYSKYVSVWKDIAKNHLELLDDLETEKKNEIRDFELDDSLEEDYISRITEITKIQKSDYATQIAKIIEPYEEKAKVNTIQNKIKDEILGQSKGGGCLIATATYGSELAPQVQQLRELRDNSLLQTESGTSFMTSFNEFYYSFSPYIADYERENPVFREMVKIAITPMISTLSILNYVDMDSEVEVLGYGISLIILNAMMYVGIPILAIMRIRK